MNIQPAKPIGLVYRNRVTSRPAASNALDSERFLVWLEVMLEMGADRAAARLAEMDEDEAHHDTTSWFNPR